MKKNNYVAPEMQTLVFEGIENCLLLSSGEQTNIDMTIGIGDL